MTESSIMQLRVTLKDVKPDTWRRVLVPTSIRYDQLHAIIQVLFGWTNSHLHSFSPINDPSTEYGMVMPDLDMGDNMLNESENFAYPDLEKGNVIYTYDFGASWTHQIELEKMITMKAFIQAGHHQLPVVVAGRGPERIEATGDRGRAFNARNIDGLFAEFAGSWDEAY